MINRMEIILAHTGHSVRESFMMILLITMTLGTLVFLAVSRMCQRIVWGLTSNSKGPEGPDGY